MGTRNVNFTQSVSCPSRLYHLRTMEELVPTCGEGRVRRRPQEPLQSQTLSHPTGPLSFLLSPVLHQQGGDFSGFSLCVPCYYCPCRGWVKVPEEPCRASLGLLSGWGSWAECFLRKIV